MGNTLKGRFRPINPDKYRGDPMNIWFRSSWERDMMNWLDTRKDIIWWASEERCVWYNNPVTKKKARYFGESHFNAYTRGKQHLDKYNSNNANTQEKSALRRHSKEVHGDKQVKYEMKLIKNFKDDPLARQVYESLKIVESKENDDYPMNSKTEFNQALIVTTKHTRGVY
mgnify:CR=1 FL=1